MRYIFVVVLVTLTQLRNKQHCGTLCYVWSLKEKRFIYVFCAVSSYLMGDFRLSRYVVSQAMPIGKHQHSLFR
jgi:hypothetical protein